MLPQAKTAAASATGSSVIVVSAFVTLRKLLLPVPRTNTSFCVEQMTPGSVSAMSVAHVVILALPPGVPSARAHTV